MSIPSTPQRLTAPASFTEDAGAAARHYAQSVRVVHIPRGEKGPRYKWTGGLSEAEIATRFARPSNVGVILGSASGGLLDVDLDCPEARVTASYVLQHTVRFGRDGNPGSHHLYYGTDGEVKREVFKDPRDGKVLAELRGDGCQTVFPPSIHPSGERVRFECAGEPVAVKVADLRRHVGTTAALALLARAWPAAGGRHDFALALAAALVREGEAPDTAQLYVEVVAEAAGDEEAGARGQSAHRAAERLEDDLPTTGWTHVAELLGPEGRAVVEAVRTWMGFSALGRLPRVASAEEALGAADRLAALSRADYAKARAALKADHPDLNLNDLEHAVGEARQALAQHAVPEDPEGRPVVVLSPDRSHKSVVDETTRAFALANAARLEALGGARAAGVLFAKDGQIVEVQGASGDAGDGAAVGSGWTTRPVSLDVLRYHMDQRLAFFQQGARGGVSTTRAPEHLVKDLFISLSGQLPALRRVSGSPLARKDGTFLTTPGYDAATGTFLKVSGDLLGGMLIPDAPTPDEVTEAVKLLERDLLGDFPFDGEASRAAALALLLTPLLVLVVPPPYPLGLVDATKRGTGKGLLADVISVVATGRVAPKMPLPGSNEEIRKTITATLLGSPAVAVFDNVDQPVRSAALEILLTTPTYSDRLLGRSEQVHLANGGLWLMTGNNLLPQGDLVRRCVRVRMDAGTARPSERAAFRHADLVGWATEHRGELLRAAFVLVRAWIAAGRPRFTDRTMGSYGEWVGVVGGILKVAGIPGFLGNADELHEVTDEDGEWEGFLEALYAYYGDGAFLARDLAPMLLESDMSSMWGPRPAMPSFMKEKEEQALRKATPPYLLAGAGSDKHRLAKALGDAFNRRRGERFGPLGLRVVADQGRTKGAKRWRVQHDGDAEPPTTPETPTG